MKRILLLAAIALALTGAQCDDSNRNKIRESDRISAGQEPAQPVPEPSGALIFGGALLVCAMVRRAR